MTFMDYGMCLSIARDANCYLMPIVILIIDIIVTNMVIKAILNPKSASSDQTWAKIEKMP
jgi:hypothetical protein